MESKGKGKGKGGGAPPPPPASCCSSPPAKKWATVTVPEPEVAASPTVAVGDDMSVGSGEKAHGLLAPEGLPLPQVARVCGEQARMGYISEAAHEYLDPPDALSAKAAVLAELVLKSRESASSAPPPALRTVSSHLSRSVRPRAP